MLRSDGGVYMKKISLSDVEKKPVTMEGARGAFKQVPISKNDGSPIFSLRVFTLEAGGNTPYHQHPYEHLNYIIAGEGVVVDERGNESVVKEGDFVLVLPDEKHQYRNTAKDESLIFICGVPKEHE